MTRNLRTQLTALSLAVAVTLATLMGLHTLAQTETAVPQIAAASAAATV